MPRASSAPVTFPYHPSLGEGQPALLARIVRTVTSHEDGHPRAVAGKKASSQAPLVLAIHFLGRHTHKPAEIALVGSAAAALTACSLAPFVCARTTFRGLNRPCRLIFGMRFRRHREYAEVRS